jgi:hypothetical protein
MSLTDSLSTFPEVFGEHYSISHARHVFSNMRDRCPKEYEEKKLSIRQAAELLNVDHKTLHQRIKLKLLIPKKEKAGRYVKRMLVSVRDIADMIINCPLKECSGKPVKRYTQNEIEELKNTGKVTGRTYDSYKVKAPRLGLKLRELRPAQSVPEEPPQEQGNRPAQHATAPCCSGEYAHIPEAGTSA